MEFSGLPTILLGVFTLRYRMRLDILEFNKMNSLTIKFKLNVHSAVFTSVATNQASGKPQCTINHYIYAALDK